MLVLHLIGRLRIPFKVSSTDYVEPQFSQDIESWLAGFAGVILAKDFPSRRIQYGSRQQDRGAGIAQGLVLNSTVHLNKSLNVVNLVWQGRIADELVTKHFGNFLASARPSFGGDRGEEILKTLETLSKEWSAMPDVIQGGCNLLRTHKIGSIHVMRHANKMIKEKSRKGKPLSEHPAFPVNPGHNAWLMKDERKWCRAIYAPYRGKYDEIISEWNKLESTEQHDQFLDTVKKLKAAYSELTKMANAMHLALGRRKQFILHQVTSDATSKLTKNEMKDSKKVMDQFEKVRGDLKGTKGIWVLNPILIDINGNLLPEINNTNAQETDLHEILSGAPLSQDYSGQDSINLWDWLKWWAAVFRPTLTDFTLKEASSPLELKNKFTSLGNIFAEPTTEDT
jgi:hypothetical protein